MSLFWLALAVFLLAPAAAFVYLVVKSVDLWRAFRDYLRSLTHATGELTAKLERLASFEPPDLDQAGEAWARAQRSQRRLRVLTNALGRAQEQLLGFAALYPKK
jgi:hypothetical protein